RLNRQPYSRQALREKLESRGHAPEAAEAAVEKLEAAGALDERALGEAMVARALRAGESMPVLRQKLERRKLRPELIEALIAEAASQFDPRAAARDLLTKK